MWKLPVLLVAAFALIGCANTVVVSETCLVIDRIPPQLGDTVVTIDALVELAAVLDALNC